MDVAEQLQLLDRRVAYLEELTAHKEAVTDEFSEVVEFPKWKPRRYSQFMPMKNGKMMNDIERWTFWGQHMYTYSMQPVNLSV